MSVVGVVVNSAPKKLAKVEQLLLALPGVEVHASNDMGRMVVTVEGDDEKLVSETVMQMHEVDGVLSTAMVYHNSEKTISEECRHDAH
ncbi:chaperone NapD [Pseudomonadota bacterium]